METNATPVLTSPAIPSVIDALRAIGMKEITNNVFTIPTKKKK